VTADGPVRASSVTVRLLLHVVVCSDDDVSIGLHALSWQRQLH
jgi:hypothetical protein